MKIFDLHADIGYDVMAKKQKGIQGIIQSIHAHKLNAGEIAYVGMASFFEGDENWAYMQEMLTSLKAEIAACEEVELVKTKDDLLHDHGHCKAVLTIEGMCGIKEEPVEKIDWLYEQGVRIASLCWNDENALATGVKGNATRGLTALGVAAVKEMIRLNMVIDVSHANEKTFWDIMELSPAMVIATHSNLRELCDHPRNLWIKQAKAIQEHDGVIGVVCAPGFVSRKKDEQDIPHLIDHVKALKASIGIDHIAIGFDFMDFYDDYDDGIDELYDCTQAQNFVNGLKQAGFEEAEIQKICYKNALRVVAKAYQ